RHRFECARGGGCGRDWRRGTWGQRGLRGARTLHAGDCDEHDGREQRENEGAIASHGRPYVSSDAPVLPDDARVAPDLGYELIDCGDGRRLERFGERTVDRPAPTADEPPRAGRASWAKPHLRFDRERGWTGRDTRPWTIALDALVLELRPTSAGQVGFF